MDVIYNEMTKKFELTYDGQTIILTASNMEDARNEARHIIKNLQEQD
jgi:hypothetical protein